jgi:sugar-specific transcriptional regulator TrmB
MAHLRDLGLSEYEARAYRGLLELGAATARDLSEASDVPMGRIYDVLGGMEDKELVRCQTAARPKKYVAVEPEAALDRLLSARRQELEARARQYEETVESLKADLNAPRRAEDFWTAAVGAEGTVELFVERIAAAESSIEMVAGPIAAGFDVGSVGGEIADRLEAAADAGVEISVLAARSLVERAPPELTARYVDATGDHENVAIRVADGVTGSFSVVDEEEVCIEVPHPVESDAAFAMIDLHDSAFAADVRAEFRPRWESARSLVAADA